MDSLASVSCSASSVSVDVVPEHRRISRIPKACLPPIATFSHNLAELTSSRKKTTDNDRSSGTETTRDPRNFFCDWPGCEKSLDRVPFRCASLLRRHMLSHRTANPVSCAECSLRFKNTENLKRHSLLHQGIRPYVCEVCHRTFSRTSGRSLCRKRHTLASQNQDRDRTGLCSKPFLSALELEVALDRFRPRPYKCSICGYRKSYTDPGSLRKHKRQCHSAPNVLLPEESQVIPDIAESPESADTTEPRCPLETSTATAVYQNAPVSNKPTPTQFLEDAALDLTESQYYTASVTDECAIDLSGDSTFRLSSAPDPIDLSSTHHNYPHMVCVTHTATVGDAEGRLLAPQTRSQQQSYNWDPEPGFSFTDLLTNMELDEVDPVFSDPIVMLHDLSLGYSPSKSHVLSPPLDLRLIHTSFP